MFIVCQNTWFVMSYIMRFGKDHAYSFCKSCLEILVELRNWICLYFKRFMK